MRTFFLVGALIPIFLSMPSRADDASFSESANAGEPAIAARKIGRRVSLVARPFDANRAITAVRFLIDGKTLSEVAAPGRFAWDTSSLRAGRHVVQVQAFSGSQFVGQSEPVAVYITDVPASVLEVPFFTYEGAGRRAQEIVAPRISTQGRIALTPHSPGRVADASVEVFLNGEKQEFAPAARLASAEELAPRKKTATPTRAPRTRREKRRHKLAQQRLASISAKDAKAARTVWIPARPLLEKLGARLRWQESNQTLVADLETAGGVRRLVLKAGESGARLAIDGRDLAVKSPVRQADNALMVPIAFCAEALDLRVSYQPKQRRVELFTAISPA